MRSQAKASSSPAARQSPWTAASVGHGNSSSSAIVRRWLVTRSRACPDVLPLNIRTSAPPEKILPSARTIKALSGVCFAAVTAPQVFDELLAEQVQGRIRQREYPESARGLEAHLFTHHCLHSGNIANGIIRSHV